MAKMLMFKKSEEKNQGRDFNFFLRKVGDPFDDVKTGG
jgi:hypothetical protein